MKRLQPHSTAALLLVFCCLLMLGFPRVAGGWGEEGHRFVNRVAAEKQPADMPLFFRNAASRLSFLGPEPDRWRDSKEVYSALRDGSAPDHFIDFDNPEEFRALPDDRYKYADWLRSKGKTPKDVGYLPYSILEGYQRIQVLFRLWRDKAMASERDQLEQNIIYYAGVVGHYVADGSQPLHTTIHYNGWSTSWNPNGFTREPLHGRFESQYVKARIKPEDFSNLVRTARRLDDPFSDIMKFLFESNARVEDLYRMDRQSRWDETNSSEDSKQFVAARLAAGAQMLADLWYTAWVNSGATRPQG